MARSCPGDNPFDLDRFLDAQEDSFDDALSEVQSGEKRTHWMWWIFPQLRGLGFSETSDRYGLSGADEARAYLRHEVLGPRLLAMCEAALSVGDRTAAEIFGDPDDMKLHSCATLFASVSPPGSVFHRVLETFFDGEVDPGTMRLLGDAG